MSQFSARFAGKSAYQIWLDLGNTGTQQDFINSLKGASGTSGSGGSVLVYNTLTDLQNAFPSGTTQPAWVIADNAWYYWSGTATVTAPADVTGLATSSVTQTSLTLTWTGSTGATSYDVYNGSTLLGNTASTSYNVSGLSASTAYTFKVIAKNSGGSSPGVTVNATTSAPATPPADVTNLATSNVSNSSATLTWTASATATSYDVYNGATLLGNTTSTTYQATGLSSSTAYTFKVIAKNAAGSSTGANINVTTLATAPNPVTNLAVTTASIAPSSIPITWTAPSGGSVVDHYEVAYWTGSNSPTIASSAVNASSTSFTVTGLHQTTAYNIRVVAIDASGNRSQATTVSGTTATLTASASPTAGTFTSSQTVTLSSNGVAGTNIYYTTDGSTPTTSSTLYSSAISVSATETIKFFAQNPVGDQSAVQTATYTINLPDTTPPVVTASPAAGTYTSAQTVILSATDNSGGAVTIYYTTDGTTPTTSSTVYSTPISISATTTLQFIGKDASGNISTPVAATYTINAPAQATYLQMNGTTDWLRLPSMTFDQVVMDVQLGASTNAYILDARTGISNGQVMNGTNGYSNWGTGISSALKDGVAMNNVTNGTFVANERHTYTFNYTAAGTDNINIFSANNVDQASNTAAVNNSFQGNIYDVKLYNAGTLVAHYDFTTGSLNDQSGQQGKALLTGGTWVGVTLPTTTQYLQLNGTTDYVRIPSNTQLQLTNNFKIQIKASLNDLTQSDAYLLGKYRYGVHKYASSGNGKVEFLTNGATGTVPAGTMTVSDNNAHTFVLQYDGTTFTTSLDGTNAYSNAATFTLATSNDSVYIGANSYNSGFIKANIYDVQIFNGGTLVAHYDFTKGTTQDQSGNGYNGILTGGTWG